MKGSGVGRKPKPSSVKNALGNPGKRSLNIGALTVPVKIPLKPSRITGDAAKEWKRLAHVLQDNSLITLLDRTALIMYVDAFAMYEEAMQELKDNELGMVSGMLQTTAKTSYQTLSGVALVLRDARNTMLSIMTQFGMTPSSRERVSINNSQTELFGSQRPSLN